MELWQIWLISACVLLIIELTLLNSYYLLAVVFAASLAALSAWFDASINIQWLMFTLGCGLGGIILYQLRPANIKENHDDISHLEGKIVSITADVSPRGRANYKSVSWAAESDDILHVGDSARIVRIHGSTLYVEAIKEH